MNGAPSEVRYFVLPDLTNPCLLARVRWPDVFEAISPTRADWQQDPGLFDLPYDPNCVQVTPEGAAELAREWGAVLDPEHGAAASLLRRMPANWSDPSRAEQRAWSVEFASRRRRSRLLERISFRRRAQPPVAPPPIASPSIVAERVIDLTDATGDTLLPTKGS